MVKNVKNQSIYETQEQKAAFYNKVYGTEARQEGMEHFTPIKDDYFKDVIAPFLVENNIQSVLDVGADYGKYASAFINLLDGGRVVAMELTKERTESLRKNLDKFGYTDVEVVQGDIEHDDIEDFDFIFLSDVLEHTENWKGVWNKCMAHSKYVYALIPKEDSWNWSPDHVVRFDDEKIHWLVQNSGGMLSVQVLQYDENNSWYVLLTFGDSK